MSDRESCDRKPGCVTGVLLVAGVVVLAVASRVATGSTGRCPAARRLAAGNAFTALTACAARAARGVAVEPRCTARALDRLAKRWVGAVRHGGCAATGDGGDVAGVLADGRARVADAAGVGRCAATVLRSAGRYGRCRFGCAAGARCDARCAARFRTQLRRVETAGRCGAGGDVATVQATVDAVVACVAERVAAGGAPPCPATTTTTSPAPSTTTTTPGAAGHDDHHRGRPHHDHDGDHRHLHHQLHRRRDDEHDRRVDHDHDDDAPAVRRHRPRLSREPPARNHLRRRPAASLHVPVRVPEWRDDR